jgi:hypothetical protein
MRWVLIFVCLLNFPGVASAAGLDAPVQYELRAAIDPAGGSIAVSGTLRTPVEAGVHEIRFGLHRTFTIRTLRIDGVDAGFSYQPSEPKSFNPATRTVIVNVPDGAVHGGTAKIDISYDGILEHIPEWGSVPGQTLAMDDQINSNLGQLASYSSWYPQFFPFGHPLSYDLEVSVPSGWIAVSAGAKSEEKSSTGVTTRWVSPRNIDIVISASPAFRIVTGQAGDIAIAVYHTEMPDAVIAREVSGLSSMMELFTGILGETSVPGNTIRHVYAPMKHGQGRAGIARQGIIVTSEGRVKDTLAVHPQATLFQDIAHEVAHFWWNFGKGQGDWINESYAEYFSALAVRSVVSPAAFEDVLSQYRQRVAGLSPDAQPLARVPANGDGFAVRYYKGALMLDDFRRIMGDEAFFAAARRFYMTYKDTSAGTEDFRSYWAAELRDPVRVNAWLDTGGPTLP